MTVGRQLAELKETADLSLFAPQVYSATGLRPRGRSQLQRTATTAANRTKITTTIRRFEFILSSPTSIRYFHFSPTAKVGKTVAQSRRERSQSPQKTGQISNRTRDALRRENMLPKWASVRERREKPDAKTPKNS